MVFSSTVFIFFFLPFTLALYYLCPRRARNTTLLLASLIFYSWGEPVYIWIMVFSAVFDYINGLLIERFTDSGKRKMAKAVLIGSVTVNLGILCFFKYSNFFIENVNGVTGGALPLLHIALPIGISFYTFQTMSYTIDVYRGETKAQKSLLRFGTYVTMFPQLVAGPIVQYKDIEGQLKERKVTADSFSYGISRFIMGLSKKILLANHIGLIWEQISGGSLAHLSAAEAWIGAAAFTFQIYFDFSGYSDMAIGLGEMFGFHFRENFNMPYCSRSITEFWRRWHISLGTWFRDYVYIPLGGNRSGRFRQVFNIMAVWGLTGLWHGASWNFAFWGLYFGLLLIAEKLVLLRYLERLPKWMSHSYCLFFVVISWVIFAFDHVKQAGMYLMAMFGLNIWKAGAGAYYYLENHAFLFAACIVCSLGEPVIRKIWTAGLLNREAFVWVKPCILFGLFFLSLCFLAGGTYNPFLYFRF